MSLSELTRHSFQSGVSPLQWLGLCKLYISNDGSNTSSDHVGNDLSNSVIGLYRSYPGHVVLKGYLECAIREGMLSVAVFVASFLQASRSPDLRNAATLDMLCRIALDAHYASGMPPIGSVVSYSESSIVVLGTIQDALVLLRTAHSLHISPSQQLLSSASELVILLLSCVTDMSQVSTAQAMVHFADTNDMLQTLRLSPDVRQVLETFAMSLSLIIGDDAKAAREAQMMQSLQLALGKSDVLGPSSDADAVTCGLVLHNLLFCRASNFGVGSGPEAVACFVAILRWTSWTPIVFYTQMLLSALNCVSQCGSTGLYTGTFSLWRAFVVGRLPRLFVMFEKALEAEGTTEPEWRAAMQAALTTVLQHSDLIARCDHVASQTGGAQSGSEYMQEDLETPRSFIRELLQHLLANGLVDLTFAVTMDPMISNENIPRLRMEAQEAVTDLASYLESKLAAETSSDDAKLLLERICRDPGCHAAFAQVIHKRFTSLTGASDVELPSHFSKLLYSHEVALDIVSLHVSVSEIISHALQFLSDYDCETVGDPQTAVSHLGDVVLFVQSTLARFQLTQESCKMREKVPPTDLFWSPAVVYAVEKLTTENATAFTAWFKALFDSNSEGIEDTILRSTKPRTLLLISATLFSHAISARADKKMDADVLNNGVSYFTGPLLNWTLVGVVKTLLREIQQKGVSATIHLEVLQTLLLSPSCPRPVLNICGPGLLRLLSARKAQGIVETSRIDSASIQRVALQSLGLDHAESLLAYSQGVWIDQPRLAIREALQSARAGKAPSIDINRCLTITSPSKFIQLLWSELSVAASLGQMEDSRRMATFILVVLPRSSSAPRLLPLFFHIILPSLITTIDQQPQEHAMDIELMVAIVSSILTAALHLEWAMHVVCQDKYVLSPSSTSIARKLAEDLRGRKHSHTSAVITQRLAASPSFVANFPVFMSTEI